MPSEDLLSILKIDNQFDITPDALCYFASGR